MRVHMFSLYANNPICSHDVPPFLMIARYGFISDRNTRLLQGLEGTGCGNHLQARPPRSSSKDYPFDSPARLAINDIENVSVSVSKYSESQRTAVNTPGPKALHNGTS